MPIRAVTPLRLLPLLLLWCAACASADEINGRVIRVADGDSLTLLTPENREVEIRLGQIDAPEREQPFNRRSRQSLSELVLRHKVRVVVEDIDQYGRTVGRVYRDDLDVNAEQIRRGMAWVYRRYAVDETLYALEEQARDASVGLWRNPNPEPPWRFRHAKAAQPAE